MRKHVQTIAFCWITCCLLFTIIFHDYYMHDYETYKRFRILLSAGPPTPPVMTNVRVNHNALKVTWKLPSSKQNTPITGHVMRIRKESAGPNIWNEIHLSKQSNYFIVRNLTAGTNYSLWLFATNVAGRSNASAVKHVKTLQKGKHCVILCANKACYLLKK